MPTPLLELQKRVVSGGPFRVGDLVDYAYSVTNTGLVALSDLRIADDRIAAVSCDRTTLEPAPTQTEPPTAIDVSDGSTALPDSGLSAGVVPAAASGLALVAAGLILVLLTRRRKLDR